jgi:hypothetical protein
VHDRFAGGCRLLPRAQLAWRASPPPIKALPLVIHVAGAPGSCGLLAAIGPPVLPPFCTTRGPGAKNIKGLREAAVFAPSSTLDIRHVFCAICNPFGLDEKPRCCP